MKETPKVLALKRFMASRGIKPHPWAQQAGLRSSTLYNFLSGTSKSLSSDSLERLARAAGVTVDELLGSPAKPPPELPAQATAPLAVEAKRVSLRWTVGIYGRLFEMDAVTIDRPVGIAADEDVVAARVDGDGLHPVPPGWTVFFTRASHDPTALVGKVAVVRVPGHAQMLVREVRRGTQAGLWTLLSWNAAPLENVEITAAHLILAITQPV
jgi:transcriptional regulator with XRE-family HTH domain